MSEQSPGGIELLTIDDYVIAGVSEFRFEVDRALGAEFRECVSKACAPQHLVKEQLLLRFIGYSPNRGHNAEVVLRDLANGGVGGGNDFDYLREDGVRNLRSTEFFGNVNRPKTTLRKCIKLFDWPGPGVIAFR